MVVYCRKGLSLVRRKSRRHKQLEILSYRYDLVEDEHAELANLNRGYEGELEFDRVLADEFNDLNFIHIKDYCFKVGRNNFSSTKAENSIDREVQIDNIIIAGDRVITFEIKNYNFDLKYDDGHWAYLNGRKFSDPLIQIRLQKSYLQKMIEDLGSNLKVFSTLVFVNPEQTIYNLPEHPEIIVRSNLLKKLRKVLFENRYDYSRLLERFKARELPESQYQGDIGVLFEELNAGVFCEECGGKLMRMTLRFFRCNKCNINRTTLKMLNRLIYELKTLNSNWKITPSLINKFSGKEISESCVRKHKEAGNIELK